MNRVPIDSITAPSSPHPAVAVFDNTYSCTLAFLNSLGSHSVPVHVYGSSLLAATRWSRFCSRYQRCPPINEPAKFLPWLRERIRAGEITRVAPTSDLIAFYLAELREEFSAEVQRTIPILTEIENCLIKSRFTAVCTAHGIATPETCAPADIDAALAFAQRVGYPLIIKAKSHLAVGMAERGGLIETPDQLRQQFYPYTMEHGHEYIAERYPELRLPLLQRFIPSATQCVYSVSGFKDARLGIVSAALSYKSEQWPQKVGTSTHQVGCADHRLLQAGLLAVDKLLSCGIFELELLVDGDQLLAIDLNPRSFGFMSLDIARGSDLPWLWFQSTCNAVAEHDLARELLPMECRQPIPFYISRLIMLIRGPNRGATAMKLWRELSKPWVSMTGQWGDPVPKLSVMLALFRHPRSLLRPYWNGHHANVRAYLDQQPMMDHAKPRKIKSPPLLGTMPKVNAAMVALEHLQTGAHPKVIITVRSTALRPDRSGASVNPP
ncbi:MAG: hypothetical protein AB7F79_00290 [Steroidobacteraceae bacterium]